MTIEEMKKNLESIMAKADEAAKAYNAAVGEKDMDAMTKAKATLDEAVGEYNKLSMNKKFEECKTAAEGPMMKAVKDLVYDTIKAKEEKTEDRSVPVMVVEPADKPIDLEKLHKYCGGIGVDKDWIYALEKLNKCMTYRVCEELGVDPQEVDDSYMMSKIAKEFDLGKNPASKTNLLKSMQRIAAMMIGEGYKPTTHHVNYILMIYAKKSKKALTVACANHKFMRQYMAEIMHSLVLQKGFEVEFKKIKA